MEHGAVLYHEPLIGGTATNLKQQQPWMWKSINLSGTVMTVTWSTPVLKDKSLLNMWPSTKGNVAQFKLPSQPEESDKT